MIDILKKWEGNKLAVNSWDLVSLDNAVAIYRTWESCRELVVPDCTGQMSLEQSFFIKRDERKSILQN